MRLQSGSMVVDFYPTKSWIDSHIFEDKFLKVLTFSGKTMVKKVVSHAEMIEERGKIKKLTFMNTIPMYQI